MRCLPPLRCQVRDSRAVLTLSSPPSFLLTSLSALSSQLPSGGESTSTSPLPQHTLCLFFTRCRFHSRTDAFKKLSIVSLTPDNCPPSETGVASCIRRAVTQQYDPASGKIPAFHLTTDPNIPNFKLQSSAIDRDFGVKLRSTLHLRRNAEYCQWSESYTQHCDRCSDGRDSEGKIK